MKTLIFEVTIHYVDNEWSDESWKVLANNDQDARERALELDTVSFTAMVEDGDILADAVPEVHYCEIKFLDEIDG